MATHLRPRRTGGLRRALALAAGLVLLAQVAPGSAQTTQEKLDDAKRRVKEIARQVDRERAKLAGIKAEILSLIRQVQQVLGQKEAIEHEIALTEKAIARKNRKVDDLQARLGERARDVYIQGPAGVLEFVLEANSLADLSDRVTFLDHLNEADASTALGIEVEREELGRFQSDLVGYKTQLEEALALLAEQDRELNKRYAAQSRITARIEQKLAEAEEVVQDLEAALKRQLLAALAAQAASSGIELKPGQGLLEHCPVDPPRSYIDDFGFPRVGHTHQGNDVFAPAGTPIRAPFAGVADESSDGLGGQVVFVRASDGTYVYNAHMSEYAGVDGKQVQPGELIGFVGNTGNAAGTPPHDHFELHPGGGSAISPYQHLNLVCGLNGG